MVQPERDQTVVQQPEYLAAREGGATTRRQLLGEQALAGFTLLPEIETSYEAARDHLLSMIIGQEAAVDAIISALDRSGVRSFGDNRPIASFAFLGPTGVGKTETAKVLSEVLSWDDPHLVRIDCSAFSHGHEVASLTGAPPGYTGREQPPILEPRRIEPYGTVVLFDEIEKGSRELTNLLLQIMDNGLIELTNGEMVSFKDAVVVMTSNLGAREMAREAGSSRAGFGVADATPRDKDVIQSAALKGFKDFFSPEFVNRLSDAVVFHPLDEPALHEVLAMKLNNMNRSYVEDYGARIRLSGVAQNHLVAQAFEQQAYGVRPLIRALEKEVISNFGRYTAQDKIQEGTEVYVYHRSELGDAVAESYKSELIFATRRDESLRAKPLVIPNDMIDPLFAMGEMGTIKDDRQTSYGNE